MSQNNSECKSGNGVAKTFLEEISKIETNDTVKQPISIGESLLKILPFPHYGLRSQIPSHSTIPTHSEYFYPILVGFNCSLFL
jgi:hypothetical protein